MRDNRLFPRVRIANHVCMLMGTPLDARVRVLTAKPTAIKFQLKLITSLQLANLIPRS